MASLFTIPIAQLRGVGPKRAELFEKLGVTSVGALLRFYPRAYEDWSQPCAIDSAPFDRPCAIRATVVKPPKEQRVRSGMLLYKAVVSDGWSDLEIVLFNNRFAAQKLEGGKEFIFYGKVGGTLTSRQMSSPAFSPADQGVCIHALYPLTEGLSNRMVESAMRQAIKMLPEVVRDPLPDELRKNHQLCGLREAMLAIHAPADPEALTAARRRLAFEELFLLQLGLLGAKGRVQKTTALVLRQDKTEEFFSLLPFSPTNAQRRAVAEGMADMQSGVPMRRLVQGDVGSGKTVVAAALCYSAAFSGLQSAVMAPTEILAEQHYKTFSALLPMLNCALLTGSLSAAQKRKLTEQLENGSIQIVIGTHALLSENVHFARLGLVVTDEQHRFGVAQRAELTEKGENPHLLVMSATPIPRTLALMLYGDLEVSVLDEMPPGRQTIRTYLIDSSMRQRAFGFIRKNLDAGHRAFVVCPLVEENEQLPDLKSVSAYFAELQNGELGGYRIGLLHGRMKSVEKEAVMAAFSTGKVQVLVATTVIEVGIDVPEANIMLIENAERFGLSQLHQLRGRVGRGKILSHCILISDMKAEDTAQRLKILASTSDGFRLAEEDLKLRGPGDFFGSRQHGTPVLQVADLYSDLPLLKEAQVAALELIQSDPGLTSPAHKTLHAAVRRLFEHTGSDILN